MDGDESNEGEEGGETIRFISNYIDNIDDNNDENPQQLPRNSAATGRRSTSSSTYPDSSFIQESPMVYSIPPTPSSSNPLRKNKSLQQKRVRGKDRSRNRPDSEGEVLDRIAESFEKARKERSRGNGREEAEDEKEKRRNFDVSRMAGEGERGVYRWGEDESRNRDGNDLYVSFEMFS